MAAFLRLRRLGRIILCIVCVASVGRLSGQDSANANSYSSEWRRHFALQTSLIPVGTADEHGTLWLITSASPGWQGNLLTKIDSEGKFIASYKPNLPLKPIEWVAYLSPAASGQSVGLLASLASGGKQQTFEGAFFVPVGPDSLADPIRIANAGPQFPTLIGDGANQFIAAGDQKPLTLVKVDSSGKVLWRRSFSNNLVLPTVSVGGSGDIYIASQAGAYVLLQKLDASGQVLRSKRIAAKQGDVTADSNGGCTLLFTEGVGGKDNKVHLLTLDADLHLVSQVETPLVGWGGRTYHLISTLRGHVVIGEGPQTSPHEEITKVMAEIDKSGKLIWQQTISSQGIPLLAPFRSGFYLIRDKDAGIDVEKYIY